jgi:hypothetical protein
MNHTTVTELIEGYINGNLSWAKREAKQFEQGEISLALMDEFGYSGRKAMLTAAHMKGEDCWQEACDAS